MDTCTGSRVPLGFDMIAEKMGIASDEDGGDENDIVDDGVDEWEHDPQIHALHEVYKTFADLLPLEEAKGLADCGSGEGDEENRRIAGGTDMVYVGRVGVVDRAHLGSLPHAPSFGGQTRPRSGRKRSKSARSLG